MTGTKKRTFCGVTANIVTGKTFDEWETTYGNDENLWSFLIEELEDGAVEVNPDIWYWEIDGRLYETSEPVEC